MDFLYLLIFLEIFIQVSPTAAVTTLNVQWNGNGNGKAPQPVRFYKPDSQGGHLVTETLPIDFVVTSTELHGKVGTYFRLDNEDEETVKFALELNGTWPSTGLKLKVQLIRDGSTMWCGDIKMWDHEATVKGVHGRKEPYNPQSGQWMQGDIIRKVDECGKECGGTRFGTRIIGGQVSDDLIPYHVGLLRNYGSFSTSPFCGGTIICPHFILTAGHCIQKRGKAEYEWGDVKPGTYRHGTRYEPDQIKVVAKERDVKDYCDQATLHLVESIHVHPKLIFTKYIVEYDFAILKLRNRIDLGVASKAKAAHLPSNAEIRFPRYTKMVTSGWGDFVGYGKGAMSDLLKHASVEICTRGDSGRPPCNRCPNLSYSPSEMCVKSNEGTGACSGDSGGPLTWNDGRKTILIGVASYIGKIGYKASCASQSYAQTPTVYAKVTSALGWINHITGGCNNNI